MANQMRKNIIWNAFGNIVFLASQWLVTMLVTRLFGYKEAGVLSLAMSIATTFQTVARFGIRNYQVSDAENKYADSCYVMLRNITCGAALLLCMIFTLLNDYSAEQIMSIFWFMIFRLAEDYSDVLYGIAQKNNRLDIVGKAFSVKAAVIFPTFILGYLFKFPLESCIMLMAFSSWSSTIFYDLFIIKKLYKFRLTYKIKNCLHLGKETIPLFIYTLLGSTITVVPKYILEKMSDETLLGAYSSIFIPAMLLQAATLYVYTPFVGSFAELYANKQYKFFLLKALKILLILIGFGLLAIVAVFIFGDSALELVFGKSIASYSNLFPLTVVAILGSSVMSYICVLEVVIRNFKHLILGCFIGFIGCVTAPFWINLFGADGASIAMITGTVSSSVYMAVNIFFKFRRYCNE